MTEEKNRWNKIPAPAIMQYFSYEHLPEHLQEVSKPFCEIANWMCKELPNNPERSAGLRKLLEAKDCAVRAKLTNPPPGP
jgi:hypothetical protein